MKNSPFPRNPLRIMASPITSRTAAAMKMSQATIGIQTPHFIRHIPYEIWPDDYISKSLLQRLGRSPVRAGMRQSPVDLHVIPGHALGVEALLERLPADASDQARNAPDCLNSLSDTFHDEACHAVRNHFGRRAVAPGDNWSPAGHRLDHYQSERLRPINREQQGAGVA